MNEPIIDVQNEVRALVIKRLCRFLGAKPEKVRIVKVTKPWVRVYQEKIVLDARTHYQFLNETYQIDAGYGRQSNVLAIRERIVS